MPLRAHKRREHAIGRKEQRDEYGRPYRGLPYVQRSSVPLVSSPSSLSTRSKGKGEPCGAAASMPPSPAAAGSATGRPRMLRYRQKDNCCAEQKRERRDEPGQEGEATCRG